LFYYRGDAYKVMPDEIKGGYDVLFFKGEVDYFLDKSEFETYVGRLRVGGHLLAYNSIARVNLPFGFFPVAKTQINTSGWHPARGCLSRKVVERKPSEPFFIENAIREQVLSDGIYYLIKEGLFVMKNLGPMMARRAPHSITRQVVRLKDNLDLLSSPRKQKKYARLAYEELKPLQEEIKKGEVLRQFLTLTGTDSRYVELVTAMKGIERLARG
jgi:hypothetical protein